MKDRQLKKWLEPQEIETPEALNEAVGGHPLVTQVLARRQVLTTAAAAAFLDPDCYQPASPTELPGMAAAANRLERAIREKEPICVWGDFDVDGQTSTTILVSTLTDLEADVSFHIPVRERESHGVNLEALKAVIAGGARLVLTCDTGITAHEAVDYARLQGVEFVITDHHALPPSLPEATAIVNPRLLPETHPLGTLSGAGVAYKLAEELFARFGRAGEAENLVDLAALGLVADLAALQGDTRYLVQRGIQALRKTTRLGLKVMMASAGLNPTWLGETHIGFELAPQLNALGRLSDASVSVEFLTTQDLARAKVIAATLEGLNARRQLLTNQVYQAALLQVEKDPSLLETRVLVLAHPAWPAGVIGIVASRLVELFTRPVVLLSNPPGELAHGSARSISGCDITTAIATQRTLLSSFGGHPMAAGLALDSERITDFRRGLSRAVATLFPDLQIEATLQIDGYLSLADLSLDLVDDFQRLAPFGSGNPPLVLAARDLGLASFSPIGRNEEHLQLTVQDRQGHAHKVLWWQGAGWELPQGRFDLAFTVQASDFRGGRDVQVEWIDARLIGGPRLPSIQSKKIDIGDFRSQAYPLAVLKKLAAEQDVQVWCEAEAFTRLAEIGIHACRREGLTQGRTLAIWTTPPGPSELRAAITQVAPDVVYLFGVDPQDTSQEDFLKRLAGLAKYALTTGQEQVELVRLASATGQREVAVRLGLDWLAEGGFLTVSEGEAGQVRLTSGGQRSDPDPVLAARLTAILEETAAFREYFCSVETPVQPA